MSYASAIPIPGSNTLTTYVDTSYQSLKDSATGYFIQTGSVYENGGLLSVTFPTPFQVAPRIIIHPPNGSGLTNAFSIVTVLTYGFEVNVTDRTNELWSWTAIGYVGRPSTGFQTITVNYLNAGVPNISTTPTLITQLLLPKGYAYSQNFQFTYTIGATMLASAGIQYGYIEFYVTQVGNGVYPPNLIVPIAHFDTYQITPQPSYNFFGPNTVVGSVTQTQDVTLCVQVWFRMASFINPFTVSMTNISGSFPTIA
jgi:hypothetical protein